ncbi:MAG: hypothetical protein DWQ04_18770 [Chloroflexi bacterium]|nr:MAG: hypothetical protein DWQ04_18770 [Chloroflexota bacterium]
MRLDCRKCGNKLNQSDDLCVKCQQPTDRLDKCETDFIYVKHNRFGWNHTMCFRAFAKNPEGKIVELARSEEFEQPENEPHESRWDYQEFVELLKKGIHAWDYQEISAGKKMWEFKFQLKPRKSSSNNSS